MMPAKVFFAEYCIASTCRNCNVTEVIRFRQYKIIPFVLLSQTFALLFSKYSCFFCFIMVVAERRHVFSFTLCRSLSDGRQQRVRRPLNNGCDGRQQRCRRPSNTHHTAKTSYKKGAMWGGFNYSSFTFTLYLIKEKDVQTPSPLT